MTKLILILALSLSASAQNTLPQFTWGTPYFGNHLDLNLNAAATHATYWFMGEGKTVNAFSFVVGSVTGTMGATDVRADLISFPVPAVTYNDGTDVVIPTGGNGYANGDRVTFYAQTTLPTGVTYGDLYYVCNQNSTNFQIDNDADCMSVVTDFSGSSGAQAIARVLERTTTISATPTGAGVYTMTFNTALSGNGMYGVRFANTNGTPASNFIALRNGAASQTMNPRTLATSNNTDGRTDGQFTSCTNMLGCGAQPRTSFYRIGWTDGSFSGQPFTAAVSTTGIPSGYRVQGDDELGTRFVVPSYVDANVTAIWMPVTKNGTPAAGSRIRVYSGANGSETLIATSDTRGIYDVPTNASIWSYPYRFSSPVRLTPGAVVRVVLSPSATGDTSTNYYSPTILTIHDNADSKALVWGHLSYFDGSAWTYSTTEFVPMTLILDQAAPFNLTGGAGGSFVHAN